MITLRWLAATTIRGYIGVLKRRCPYLVPISWGNLKTDKINLNFKVVEK